MGIYVYKVLKDSVLLENGERAHIAVFAYKESWNNPKNTHWKTGAGRCDEAAENGQRGPWIVGAYKNEDGTIEVNRIAYKAKRPLGSYVEEFSRVDECAVVEAKLPKKMRFFPLPKESRPFNEV